MPIEKYTSVEICPCHLRITESSGGYSFAHLCALLYTMCAEINLLGANLLRHFLCGVLLCSMAYRAPLPGAWV
jgi:hypothetical protein